MVFVCFWSSPTHPKSNQFDSYQLEFIQINWLHQGIDNSLNYQSNFKKKKKKTVEDTGSKIGSVPFVETFVTAPALFIYQQIDQEKNQFVSKENKYVNTGIFNMSRKHSAFHFSAVLAQQQQKKKKKKFKKKKEKKREMCSISMLFMEDLYF